MTTRKTTFSLAHLVPPGEHGSPMKRRPAAISIPSADTATATPPRPKKDEERVKVYVRIRPTQQSETPHAMKFSKDGLTLTRGDGYTLQQQEFAFDGVLGPSATQADVYDIAAKSAVKDVLQGYNATLLAYGQSGSGKTHTLGSIEPNAVGIIPRALGDIFSSLETDPAHIYSVTLSYLQIYCEQIQDLLCPDSGDNLSIREGHKGGVYVPDLQQVEVASLEECLQLLQLGAQNRSVAFTALNAHSSRSHAVVIATVMKRPLRAQKSVKADKLHVGKLFMVDLAGSERLKKSKSLGQNATEAKAINLSLTTLGMCVSARATGNATHIPFRDSKLTRLLQESLGGNARTSLVIAVCDAVEHAEETFQSLQFGSRAMRVTTRAKINEHIVDTEGLSGEGAAGIGSPLHTSRTSALVQSLLEKENQLEAVQAQLRMHEEQGRQVVEALRKEHADVAARAAALSAQHEAQQAQQEVLYRAVKEAEERVEEVEMQWSLEKESMLKELISLKADALRNANEADAAHALLESERVAMQQRLDEERSAMRNELEAERTAMEKQLEEERSARQRSEAAHLTALEEKHAEMQRKIDDERAASEDLQNKLQKQLADEQSAAQQQLEEERRARERAEIAHLAALEALKHEFSAQKAAESEAAAQQWAEEKRQVERKFTEELNDTVAHEVEKTETLWAECESLRQQLAAAETTAAAQLCAAAENLKKVEQEWAAKRRATIEKMEGRKQELKAEIAKRDAHIAQLQSVLQQSQEEMKEVDATVAHLRQQLEEKNTMNEDLLYELKQMQAHVVAVRESAAVADARATAAERSRAKLAASMLRDKRLNKAATVVQRAFRAYRVRKLQMQRSQGYAALSEAHVALGSLAQQHADLAERRHSNLAVVGQTLVAESLGTVQDLVETLVAEFLCPAKDLKALQRLRAKAPAVSGGGGGGSGGLASQRYGNNSDLIGAIRVPVPDSEQQQQQKQRYQGYQSRGRETPEYSQMSSGKSASTFRY